MRVLEGLFDHGFGEVLEGRSADIKKAILNLLIPSAPLASRMLNVTTSSEHTALSQLDVQEQALYQGFVIDPSSSSKLMLPSWPAKSVFPVEEYDLHLPDPSYGCSNIHPESSVYLARIARSTLTATTTITTTERCYTAMLRTEQIG